MTTEEAYRKNIADKTAAIVARTILRRREELFDTRKQFSAILGVQESTVLRTELGRYHFKIESLVEYCMILGLDPAKVLADAMQEAKESVKK